MDTTQPRSLLHSLGIVADATSSQELATAVLSCLVGFVGAETAMVAHFDRVAGTATAHWTWPGGFFTPEEAARFEELNQTDPWVLATHSRTHGASPLRISDRLTELQYRSLPIYSALFRSLEIGHQVAFSLPGGSSWSTCVVLNRDRRDFSDGERDGLEALRHPLSALVAHTVMRLELRGDGRAHHSRGLSGREVAVLGLVADGLSNDQIGRRLGISVRTVEKHLEHVYAKTDTRNRTEAAVWWLAAPRRWDESTPYAIPRTGTGNLSQGGARQGEPV